MLGLAIRSPRMSREQDRAPLSTEISPLETKVDPHAFGRDHSVSPDDKPVRAPSDGLETAPDERLAIGQRLSGRYRIERELGVGGMGVVYLATDEQIVGEVFAIKVLKEDLHPEALDLLREEVHKTRRLSHPNIVNVHSVRSEEHTSELQSPYDLVCRLLLEKKKNTK